MFSASRNKVIRQKMVYKKMRVRYNTKEVGSNLLIGPNLTVYHPLITRPLYIVDTNNRTIKFDLCWSLFLVHNLQDLISFLSCSEISVQVVVPKYLKEFIRLRLEAEICADNLAVSVCREVWSQFSLLNSNWFVSGGLWILLAVVYVSVVALKSSVCPFLAYLQIIVLHFLCFIYWWASTSFLFCMAASFSLVARILLFCEKTS